MDVKNYIRIFEQSPDMLLVLDTSFIIVAASDNYLKSTLTKREHIVGCDVFKVFPDNPGDHTANGASIMRASFNRVLETKVPDLLPVVKYDIPKPELEGGGFEVKYWQVTHSPLLDEDNNVKYIIQRAKDVTENAALITQLELEQKALKQVEDSEKRYNMMLMKSPFAFAVLKGKKMVITLANDSIKEMWGKGKDLEGKPLLEVLPELKDSEFPGLLDKVYTTGVPFSGEDLLAPVFRNGKLEDLYFNFVYQPYLEADESISGVTIIAYEVTNEVIAKQKIKDSQQQLQNIFMQAPFALNIYEGKELVISLANKLFCEIIGKTESEILGKKLFDAFPETATQGLDKILSDIFSNGIPFKGNEFPVHFLKHGNDFKGYFDFIYQPIFDYNKNVSGVINIAIDVTDKVLARKKIEESEIHFRHLADLVPAKISNANPEGKVLYFNKHWLDYTGYSFEELRDFGYHKIIHPDELNEFKKRFQQAADTSSVLEMEMRFMNKEGNYRWHLNLASPIKDEKGHIKMWVGSTTDIHEQKTVSEKIKASEERFRSLIKHAPVAICVLRGEEYRIETINNSMLEIWDRTKEEAINRPAFDVLKDNREKGLKEVLDYVYKTGNRFLSPELPLSINRNGDLEEIFVTFHYEPLIEADGVISGIMVLAHEITEQVSARKAIEISEKKFRLLTNAMPQKITNADADGNVIFFNQQWVDDTGLTSDELIDWGWKKAMHPDDLELTVNNWKHSVATGDIFDMECRILNKEDGYRWNLSRAVPIKDETGKIIMWVGSTTDIHELKAAKSKAEEAMKAKQQFLANMSHEIRTPMNSVIGFTNVLLKTTLNEAQKRYLNSIKISGDALIVLINDILDNAKVDAGKITFEQTPFPFLETIATNVHLFEPKIEEKKLQLIEKYDIAIPEILVGDPVRLRQIVLNLMSNAVKFTDNGNITVSVRMLKEEANQIAVEFSVTDTGIGIAENKLEDIFEAFQQATYETARSYGGTGLGLSIVKKFVELQGGSYFVNSKPGEGSTFGFILNFKRPTGETIEKQVIKETDQVVFEPAEKIDNISILVAEEMPLNQLLIKIILEDFNYAVDIAADGKIAIEMLQKNQYNIILMDLQMPEMNGFEATSFIRNEMKSEIPIIALTADVTTVDIEKCKASGMNDYISKPIDEKLLFTKIMKYIKK